MNDDWITISGQPNIQLPCMSTGLPGHAGGLERVLRCVERITTVSNDRRPISGRFQKRQKPVPRVVHGRDSPWQAHHETGELVSRILTPDTSSQRFRSSVPRAVQMSLGGSSHLRNSISWYVGRGQRSSATRTSSWSPAVRTRFMAGMIASRACLAWASESPSGCSSITALSPSIDA